MSLEHLLQDGRGLRIALDDGVARGRARRLRALGLDDKALNAFIVDKAKLWLNDGPTFGPGGSGFQRLNAACPRSVLEQGLSQLAAAISA